MRRLTIGLKRTPRGRVGYRREAIGAGSRTVRREMKERRPPKTMSEALDFLLYDLCVDLGFCLPPADTARICGEESWDADAFVAEVFRAEGMDPSEHLELKRQMRNRFVEMLGSSSVDSESFERRQQCSG